MCCGAVTIATAVRVQGTTIPVTKYVSVHSSLVWQQFREGMRDLVVNKNLRSVGVYVYLVLVLLVSKHNKGIGETASCVT